jgi:hypothetical protein
MEGKYLITTDGWFIAPDGQEYKAVWGDVLILEDSLLGLKTNRNSTNWYAKVGTESNHVVVAGCQIHYAVKCDSKPKSDGCVSWNIGENNYNEAKTPTRIYFTE